MERRGPGAVGWIIAAIILLTVGGMIATITISLSNDVPSGYIPPEQRGR